MRSPILCAPLKCSQYQACAISVRQGLLSEGAVSCKYHLVKGLLLQVMRVRSVDEFEYHMCPNEDHAWDHIPRAAYAEHSQDTCPECGACRFLQDTLKPVKVREGYAGHLVWSLHRQWQGVSQTRSFIVL